MVQASLRAVSGMYMVLDGTSPTVIWIACRLKFTSTGRTSSLLNPLGTPSLRLRQGPSIVWNFASERPPFSKAAKPVHKRHSPRYGSVLYLEFEHSHTVSHSFHVDIFHIHSFFA